MVLGLLDHSHSNNNDGSKCSKWFNHYKPIFIEPQVYKLFYKSALPQMLETKHEVLSTRVWKAWLPIPSVVNKKRIWRCAFLIWLMWPAECPGSSHWTSGKVMHEFQKGTLCTWSSHSIWKDKSRSTQSSPQPADSPKLPTELLFKCYSPRLDMWKDELNPTSWKGIKVNLVGSNALYLTPTQ